MTMTHVIIPQAANPAPFSPTLLRLGPPLNFNFNGPNDPNLYRQPMARLTTKQAISLWEGFTTAWIQETLNRPARGG